MFIQRAKPIGIMAILTTSVRLSEVLLYYYLPLMEIHVSLFEFIALWSVSRCKLSSSLLQII